MVFKEEIDEIDRKIINALQLNPDISQNELAKVVNLSQPSVSARIKKLRKNGILSANFGIDIKKAGLHVAKIEVDDVDIDKFKSCPYVLSILSTNNGHIIFVTGEDYSSMEHFVKKNFGDVEMKIIIDVFPHLIMPVKMEKNGCKMNCRECPYYLTGQCLGCPFFEEYKGKLW
ncbi:MAG: winged helix-turn-helix transcriptional regulator [Thermoplasmata archaeon]|nr:winged helix-turn-helix transcriptional regulator [Thermoplasmata archaeon]